MRNDLDIYDRRADDWWNARSSAFRSLHVVKRYHLAAITSRLEHRTDETPLAGLRIADLGCGGGLLAVPLAERGAHVTAVDRSTASLAAARTEAERRGIATLTTLAADLTSTDLPAASFDAVILSDVVEHVDPFDAAIAEAARLVRFDGLVYVNTFNRTRRAAWLAVHLAEGVGLVPRGTHDPALFVTPDELTAAASRHDLQLEHLQGEAVAPWPTLRHRAIHLRPSASLAVGYAAWFVRRSSAAPESPMVPDR